MSNEAFRLVRLRNGAQSVHALAYGETMHPGLGPAAEAEALYVKQLQLVERLRQHDGEFVVWDVGLGAAANAIALLRAARDCEKRQRTGAVQDAGAQPGARFSRSVLDCASPLALSGANARDTLALSECATLRFVSFDNSAEPLRFALGHAAELSYLSDFIDPLNSLLAHGAASFPAGRLRVNWQFVMADFPSWLRSSNAAGTPKPHAILFDPFSPARNPVMWSAPLFADLFALLDTSRPCSLATYSRSTMTRAALLLAGFHVGIGRATGLKEETTVAANTPALIAELLDPKWLERARRSTSAEPLREAVYRQAPLTPATWARLAAHPQFQKA